MRIRYSYTSGYFLIYDDEYGHVHYDDDDDDDDDDHHHHHASHDIQEFDDLQTSSYRQLARLDGSKGGVNLLGTHARTCKSCVGKYYTFNFVRIGGHIYDGFNNRSLILSCMCLYSLTPTVKFTY